MPRIKTSNCVCCLLWFGSDAIGIQKNAQHIFLKEAKAAASQLRSPPAMEAKAMSLNDEEK